MEASLPDETDLAVVETDAEGWKLLLDRRNLSEQKAVNTVTKNIELLRFWELLNLHP